MTISNIHIGLAAWQTAHSYNIGDRVSSSGNAYQAINAGISGSIVPSGTGGRGPAPTDGVITWHFLSAIDYSTLMAWGNAIPSTLTSDIVGQVWNDGVITTTDQVPFLTLGVSGAQRNTGIYTITLKCAAGESFRDRLRGTNTPLAANAANGVCFQLPSAGLGGINYFDIYDSPVILDGLQFIDPYATSKATILNANAATVLSVTHCIIDGYAQDSGATMVVGQVALLMSNCLIIDRTATNVNGIASSSGDVSSTIVNNTFVRLNGAGTAFASAYLINSAAATVRNNIICGYVNPVGGSGNAALVDHCVFDSPTVGFATNNGNNQFSIVVANQFVSVSSDFRLKPGSACLNAGVTDSTDIPLSTDIIGYTRPQGTAWAVGAAEFTGQFTATINIGALQSIATVAITNNLSITKSIATIRSVIQAQQVDYISAVVSLTAISARGLSSLSDITTSISSIGMMSSVASITRTLNLMTAQISLPMQSVGRFGNVNYASSISGFGPVTATASAIMVNELTANLSIPISLVAAAAQVGISATLSLNITSIARISASILYINAQLSLAIVPVVTVLQVISAHGSGTITPMVTASAFQSTITALISLVPTGQGTVRNNPRLRVSQLPIEMLSSGGAVHVSQTAIEMLSRGGALHVSQTAIEVLTQSASASAGRVSQIVSEVLGLGTPRALASQVVQEVLTGGSINQNVRITQVLNEVLTGGATTQDVFITQVVLETLISAVPLNNSSTTYIAV